MPGATDAPVVLEARGITKTFPGVIANQDVDLSLRAGEIHCLLGENGAGKSTLMNVLYGLYKPDGGEIAVGGEVVAFESSADAIARGVGMVHQHFQLIPTFTVAENVALGNETSSRGRLDLGVTRERIRDIASRYGLAVDPDAVVGELSVGVQQRVELIKALERDAEILILDEPTAVLTPGEVDDFFEVVRTLVARGKSIIFITHKLREVLAVADRITVLRGGRTVGSADPATATEQDLANLMVGRDVVFTVEKPPAHPGEPVLRVTDLHVDDNRGVPTVQGLSLTVRAGEIFGIAGVEGNGQRELVEAITGMRPPTAGTIVLGDDDDITAASPREVADRGVGHVPEDRGRHGVVGSFSIVDNVVLNRYHQQPFSQRFLRREAPMRELATRLVEQFDVRTPGIDVPVDTLSGGNQQKVVVAREMSRDLRLLVVAQPTRGLDVGSIEFIHRRIVELRDQGVAVLLVSAELDEILSLSDRIGVLYRGALVGEFDRQATSREEVGLLMASGAPRTAEEVAP